MVCNGDVACRRLFLSIFLVLSNFWNVSFKQCTSVYIFGQVFYSKIQVTLFNIAFLAKNICRSSNHVFLLQILCNCLSSFIRKSSQKYQDTLSFGMDNRHTMCQSSGKFMNCYYERSAATGLVRFHQQDETYFIQFPIECKE